MADPDSCFATEDGCVLGLSRQLLNCNVELFFAEGTPWDSSSTYAQVQSSAVAYKDVGGSFTASWDATDGRAEALFGQTSVDDPSGQQFQQVAVVVNCNAFTGNQWVHKIYQWPTPQTIPVTIDAIVITNGPQGAAVDLVGD